MSTIGGIDSSAVSFLRQDATSRQDPAERIKALDEDSSGTLDTTELSELAIELSQMSGKTLEVEEAINTYDTDGDGQLSQEEVMTLIREYLGPPPGSGNGTDRLIQSYLANSGAEKSDVLLNMLDELRQNQIDAEDQAAKEARFVELDTDSSGGLSEDELSKVAEKLSKMAGSEFETEELLAAYDSDEDGELSAAEMDEMMRDLQQSRGAVPPPPPPISAERLMVPEEGDLLDQIVSSTDTTDESDS
mgnify:CR=1 FL=1